MESEKIDSFLVEIFHTILKTEESHVTREFPGLSLREVHILDAVARAVENGGDNRPSAIAASQRVTAGTMTVEIAQLVRKGCLIRKQDQIDGRAVRLFLAPAGQQVVDEHRRFHRRMVEQVRKTMSEEELTVLIRLLGSLTSFFSEKENCL